MLKEEMRITELAFFSMCHGLESSRNRPETKNESKQFIQATEDWGMRDKKREESQYLCYEQVGTVGNWSPVFLRPLGAV